ncbi:MAG: tRNA 5-methoxyuridine(34)/uridine 5-oxyacetic acid(34) synthase CmoB [Campylobacter sp.]|nr:tRNA 5-methoxyuridine(34)/uridine 5-oxyacetic acid(34) synthase CmoB [Campylobacter sp.]
MNHDELKLRLDALDFELKSASFGDCVELDFARLSDESEIKSIAKALMPWRKGPFRLAELFIDSEWRSFVKFNALLPHFESSGKRIADVGCNNGYYMFRLNALGARQIVGFDPSELFSSQFAFINHFLKTSIIFERLGVEDLPAYAAQNGAFELIFCLGVLYHRSDPISALKQLKSALAKNGELILDTLIIDRYDELVLSPAKSYAKMSNAYFIPSLRALEGWAARARFSSFELLFTSDTDLNEQRKTQWIGGQSLNDFLSSDGLTIEGYPAPKRAYIKLK